MKQHYYVMLWVCCMLLVCSLKAQVKTRIYKPELSTQVFRSKASTGKSITVKAPDEFQNFRQKVLNREPLGKDNRYAVTSLTSIDIMKEATVSKGDDHIIYSASIVAEGALNISCRFGEFKLPEGVTLDIYTEREFTEGIGSEQNNTQNIWATRLYQGNRLYFRITVPSTASQLPVLKIDKIHFGFKNAGVDFGNIGWSAACQINANCALGNGWDPEKNSVAMIVAGGIEWCTGTLLMNACANTTPYLLTAFHCADSPPADVTNWVFQFQTWSTDCATNTGWIETSQYNGCTVRAGYDPTDMLLLQLNTTPATNSGIHYAGWSRVTAGITSVTILSHPAGDLMKIARDDDAPTAVTDVNGGVSRASWELQLNDGIVEGGSSGAAYFNQNHRVIGQHYRRPDVLTLPPCDITETIGPRFDQSWTGGGTNSTRLSNWLDPLGTGLTTTNTTNRSLLNTPVTVGTLTVSGASDLCSGTTGYTLLNNGIAFPNAVAWTSSSPAVATVNASSGVVTYQSAGTTTITATINDCGVTRQAAKTIECGTPGYLYEIVHQPISDFTFCHELNRTYTFQAQPTSSDPLWGSGTFQWSLVNLTTFQAVPVGSTTHNVSFQFPTDGEYSLKVRRTNSCGQGPWSAYEDFGDYLYAGSECFGGLLVVALPNPTSGHIILTIDDSRKKNAGIVEKAPVIVALKDFYTGRLVKQWRFAHMPKRQRLDLTGVKKGAYVLQVINGSDTEVRKIFVQ